jgi:hypothetical protein
MKGSFIMRKTTSEKIQSELERKRQIENQIKQLQQRQRKEDERARVNRLCFRGGTVEKFLPELKTFTPEQFGVFLNKVILSEQSKRIIADIADKQNGATAQQSKSAPTDKKTETAAENTGQG